MFDVAADDPFPAPSQNDEEGMRFYLKRMLTWAESVGIKVIGMYFCHHQRKIMNLKVRRKTQNRFRFLFVANYENLVGI
jgi:hypothetical protein